MLLCEAIPPTCIDICLGICPSIVFDRGGGDVAPPSSLSILLSILFSLPVVEVERATRPLSMAVRNRDSRNSPSFTFSCNTTNKYDIEYAALLPAYEVIIKEAYQKTVNITYHWCAIANPYIRYILLHTLCNHPCSPYDNTIYQCRCCCNGDDYGDVVLAAALHLWAGTAR